MQNRAAEPDARAVYTVGELTIDVVEDDPNFSSAYSGLARAKFQMLEFRTGDSFESDFKQMQIEVRDNSQKALALDNRNADAWQILGAVEEDLDRAELYGRRAVALEPNLARAQFGLARTVKAIALESAPQRFDEVISLVEKAMQLDPLEPRYPIYLAEIYFFQRATEIGRVRPLVKRAL